MKALGALLGMAIIVGVVWLLGLGVYHGSSYLWDYYLVLDVELRTVLLTGVGALLVAAMIVASALRYAARTRARSGLIEPKRLLYIELTDLYRRALVHGDHTAGAVHDETTAELERLEPALLMLASASVYKSHVELKAAIEAGQWDTDGAEKLFKRFVADARKDLRRPRLYEETRLDIELKVRNKPPVEGADEVSGRRGEAVGRHQQH